MKYTGNNTLKSTHRFFWILIEFVPVYDDLLIQGGSPTADHGFEDRRTEGNKANCEVSVMYAMRCFVGKPMEFGPGRYKNTCTYISTITSVQEEVE